MLDRQSPRPEAVIWDLPSFAPGQVKQTNETIINDVVFNKFQDWNSVNSVSFSQKLIHYIKSK